MKVVVQIPYRRLPRIGVEQQVIWITIEIKVRHTRYVPPGPSRGPERVADAQVIVKIPYRRVPRAGVEQQVIWMTIEIEVRHTRYAPAQPKAWARTRGRCATLLFKIPYRRVPRTGIE